MKLWLTYAWSDNENKDIDFIIQELDKTDLEVSFDRRNLVPGQRLWSQIGGIITDPQECRAWGIVLTRNSLHSESCVEELSYALERALSSKEADFPVFALLHHIQANELPPALKIRLCISLEQADWVRRVVAAVKHEAPGFVPSGLSDYELKETLAEEGYCLEIRPRFERISPFRVAVEYEEKVSGNITGFGHGPANIPTTGFVAFDSIDCEATLSDGAHVWVWGASNEASSTYSYYLFYKKPPRRVWFGHQQNLRCLTY